jgi:hypothetical protein
MEAAVLAAWWVANRGFKTLRERYLRPRDFAFMLNGSLFLPRSL